MKTLDLHKSVNNQFPFYIQNIFNSTAALQLPNKPTQARGHVVQTKLPTAQALHDTCLTLKISPSTARLIQRILLAMLVPEMSTSGKSTR